MIGMTSGSCSVYGCRYSSKSILLTFIRKTVTTLELCLKNNFFFLQNIIKRIILSDGCIIKYKIVLILIYLCDVPA